MTLREWRQNLLNGSPWFLPLEASSQHLTSLWDLRCSVLSLRSSCSNGLPFPLKWSRHAPCSSRLICQMDDQYIFSQSMAFRSLNVNGTPLQYSCLEDPMDGGAWKAAVRGIAEGRTCLSDFTFTFHFHTLEKEMATHSSVIAWRILGTGKPGGLPLMGSHRVGHD